MADTIQTVSHGEPGWDKKVNSNFAALNNALQKVGGVVNQRQWTKFSREGLVASSNAQIMDGGYSYLDMGDNKLVLLAISVKINGDVKGISVPDLVTLPDVIATNSFWINWAGGLTEFQINNRKVMLGDTSGNANRQWGGQTFLITKLYVA
ncbi:hypothetical protein [Limosilactobacillus oris]|uniref:hypothetical protein n=1 Tax=Limosilactobacillus oris TaxID=1632 RepID=UPI0024B39B04|nr:hypothetical protein [Limosilactobacillus oris]WHO84889.1 hypothetical protein QLX69_05825 [Limosilactobacillus oris]